MPYAGSAYTPQNAIDVCSDYVKSVGYADIDEELVDMVHSTMWTYYPWRWSVASLTAISLTDGVQDYSVAAGDNNVLRLLRLRITRTDTTPDDYQDIPNIVEFLPPDLVKVDYKNINSACHLYPSMSADKIRLSRAVNVPSGVTLTINGEYQAGPTKIDNSDLADSSVFPWPDVFFPILIDGMLHYLYKFADDPRAGEIRVDSKGNAIYTGQLGMFMYGLERMAIAEKWGVADTRYPETPLGASGYFGGPPGLFG